MLLAIVLLVSFIIFGVGFSHYFKLPFGFFSGIVAGALVGTTILFILGWIFGLYFGIVATTIACFCFGFFLLRQDSLACLVPTKRQMLVFLASLVLLFALSMVFWHYSPDGGIKGVATDFGFHFGVISNLVHEQQLPPQNPMIGTELFHYYFFIHLFVAALTIGGIEQLLALQLTVSLFGATFITLLFFALSRLVKPKLLASALVLFSGSLAFMYYSLSNGVQAINAVAYRPAIGWGTINVLIDNILSSPPTILAFCIFALFIAMLSSKQRLRTWIAFGVLLALLPMFNAFYFATLLFIAVLSSLLLKEWKRAAILCSTALLALPAAAYLFLRGQWSDYAIHFSLGWISPDKTLFGILVFWTANIGVMIFALSFGWKKAPREFKAAFIAGLPLFAAINLLNILPMPWDNYRLITFFLMIGYCIAAIGIVDLFKNKHKIIAIALFFLLICPGLLQMISVIDLASSPTAIIYSGQEMKACKEMNALIPSGVLIASRGEQSCLLGMYGHKFFLEHEEYASTHGLDASRLKAINQEILEGNCSIIRQYGVSHFFFSNNLARGASVNESFLQEHAVKVYEAPLGGYGERLYKINCA